MKAPTMFLFAGTDDLLLALPKSRQKARLSSVRSGAVVKHTSAAELLSRALLTQRLFFVRQSSLGVACAFIQQTHRARSNEPNQTTRQCLSRQNIDKTWHCQVPWRLTGMRSAPGAGVRKLDNFLWRTNDAFRPTGGSPLVRLSSLSTAAREYGAALDLLHTFGSSQKYGIGSWPQEQGVGSHA